MKKKTLIAGIVVVLLIVFYIIGKVAPPASEDDSNNSSTQIQSSLRSESESSNESITQPAEESDDTSDSSQNIQHSSFGWDASKSSATEGSNARVDEILLKAMDDAKNVSGDADSLCTEALSYLKEHAPNFYENNETMEKSMYYGCFIYRYIEETAGAKDISELNHEDQLRYNAGYNTVKAIKYVYRGIEKIEDDSTQNALKDAQDSLDKAE